MLETELLGAIRDAVNRSGLGVVWRNNVGCLAGVRYGLGVGSADLVGIGPGGKFLAIEVKTGVGRLSKTQLMWLEVVRKRGGIAFVARSVSEALDELQAVSSTHH